ncbi:HK97 family phage prohead protease [Klenkia sp. LSe6-5]|uniref:HK97 family phage prohead protease n=1 Tax=Klenkia sesuvii TaxID=3103137 RepID=A0ABU8E0V1_9ACTN
MRELRTVALQTPEVRAATEEGADVLEFTGHAAVFNEPTWIGSKRWGFKEVVDPGFFRDVLNDPVAFLVNHDPNQLLARNGNTMTLSVDDRGLVPVAQWDAGDPDAAMWAGRVRRGDITQMSFSFDVAEDSWLFDEDTGEETRTLLTASALYDVSLVTYPAYAGTDGAMRDQAAEVVKRHRGYDPRTEDRPLTRRKQHLTAQERAAAQAARWRLELPTA